MTARDRKAADRREQRAAERARAHARHDAVASLAREIYIHSSNNVGRSFDCAEAFIEEAHRRRRDIETRRDPKKIDAKERNRREKLSDSGNL